MLKNISDLFVINHKISKPCIFPYIQTHEQFFFYKCEYVCSQIFIVLADFFYYVVIHILRNFFIRKRVLASSIVLMQYVLTVRFL